MAKFYYFNFSAKFEKTNFTCKIFSLDFEGIKHYLHRFVIFQISTFYTKFLKCRKAKYCTTCLTRDHFWQPLIIFTSIKNNLRFSLFKMKKFLSTFFILIINHLKKFPLVKINYFIFLHSVIP